MLSNQNKNIKMKKNIHPKIYNKQIIMSNGSTFPLNILSTLNKQIFLEVDPLNNNIWNPTKKNVVKQKGQLAKFYKKFNN
jgi:ribosomal protein L31